MAKKIVNCGYNSVNLIRKPFKGLTKSSNSASGLRLQPLGDFNLIPVDGYYNVENKIFPLDNDIDGFNASQWKIYVISDPEVGVLIPHIKKETKNNLIIRYKNIDLDGLFNEPDIKAFLSSYKSSVNDSTDKVSVTDFIFAQPVFLRKTTDSTYSWYVYLPSYKVNDDDIVFDYQQWGQFGNYFTTNSSLEINDVVISNQEVDNMNFSQFGIGKNGISLKNGLSYTISNTGDVNFNVGNIKSDTTPFMKVRMKLDGASTPTTFDKKLDSDSYKKGDVLSGTLLTSLMGTILQNLYSKLVYSCTTASTTQTKSVTISESKFPNEGILLHLKNANTAESPNFKYNRVIPATGTQTMDATISSTPVPITYNNKTGSELKSIPAGYYKVTPIYDNNNHTFTGWKFTTDSLYTQINLLMNKISKFDFLIVKK